MKTVQFELDLVCPHPYFNFEKPFSRVTTKEKKLSGTEPHTAW